MAAAAFAQETVSAIDTMLGELKRSPPPSWASSAMQTFSALNVYLALSSRSDPNEFIKKMEATQPYLDDLVKALPTDWRGLSAEAFLTKLKEDINSAKKSMGGRRTRKHRSRSRKYRSRR